VYWYHYGMTKFKGTLNHLNYSAIFRSTYIICWKWWPPGLGLFSVVR